MKNTIVVAMLCAGCAVGEVEPGEPEAELEVEFREEPFDLGVEENVCPETRHIVWLKNPDLGCPDIDPWIGKSLFGEGTDYLAEREVELSDELARVCRYEWGGMQATPPQGAIDSLYGDPRVDEAGSDCEVLFPQTIQNDAITDQVDDVLEDLFRDAIGWMNGKDLALATTEAQRRRVHVVVADTQPHHEPTNSRAKHGEAISRMIEAIACPQGPNGCAVSVERVLTMPRWRGGVDYARGGYYGSFGDAAAGIKESLERWREVNQGVANPSRLVINFSAGWHPFAALGTGGPGERAVKLAIEEARCYGATIVASAGNEDTFCAEVPLLPAGWETEPAPNATRCAEVGAPAPQYMGAYRPLVHSVGGLDIHGDEIENGREGGRPRLAAAGSHVLVDAATIPTPPMTGTSVSSGVVSAIAALVWSYNGPLRADQVMGALYTGGYPLEEPATADYGLGNPMAVRRVDACGALEEACGISGKCPKEIDFSHCDNGAWPDGDDVLTAIAELTPDKTVRSTFSRLRTQCVSACGEPFSLYTVAGAVPDCGKVEVRTPDVMISPQPDTQLCEVCSLTKDLVTPTTRASLNDDFSGASIDDLVVYVRYADGTEDVFDFNKQVQLDSDKITDIVLPELKDQAEIVKAEITITLGSGYTQSDPLLLEEVP